MSNKKGMWLEVVTITPKMAAEWLSAKNAGNRKVRQKKVDLFARAMSSGHWLLTHQGISFDENGALLDGQHRLAAVVQSGMSVRMVVAHGQPRGNMRALDVGTVRAHADILHLLYGIESAKTRAAVAGVVLSVKHGHLAGQRLSTVEEIRAELTEWSEHYDWMMEHPIRTRKPAAAPILAALVYAYPVAPDQVRQFADLLVEPANVPTGSIVFRAIEVVGEGCRSRCGDSRMTPFRRMLRCIKGYLLDEKLKLVKDNDDGLKYFIAARAEVLPE